MRSVIITLAAAGLVACAPKVDLDNAMAKNDGMTFNWSATDPCALESIVVGPNRKCKNNPNPKFPAACAGRGKRVVFYSQPNNSEFFIYFSPDDSGMKVTDKGRQLNIHQKAPYVTYKFTVVRNESQCLSKPIDPHIRVVDDENDATMGHGSQSQQPAAEEPTQPVVDPGPN